MLFQQKILLYQSNFVTQTKCFVMTTKYFVKTTKKVLLDKFFSQCIFRKVFFFIKNLQFISTNFWTFWHFPSHWPASRAISLPYRLKCCFWALLWSLAYWHKFYSPKISTKRSPVESNAGILVDSQYPGTCVLKKIDIDWSPRFPDLIPPKFFLSGFLKSKVYANNPNTIQELKNNIRAEMETISPETLANVMENASKRSRFCLTNNGGHLIDIVFGN